jgi:hypothetical protein
MSGPGRDAMQPTAQTAIPSVAELSLELGFLATALPH